MPAPRCFGWVAPPFDGPPTGGTLYNARLVRALVGEGCSVERLEVAAASGGAARADVWVVDSLHLDALPRLAREAPPATRTVALVHYLPSWVRAGRVSPALDDGELAALAAADAVVATSSTAGDAVAAALPLGSRVCVVEPGAELAPAPLRPARVPIEALVVANVTEGKGLLPLLEALVAQARAADALHLCVVGSQKAQPDYVAACRVAARRLPSSLTLRFEGVVAPAAMPARMAQADLLVSASRMESYGMALSEARALGLPALALARGHVPRLVSADAGGELAADDAALARALLRLAREPQRITERARLARGHAVARSWRQAARELLAQLSSAS